MGLSYEPDGCCISNILILRSFGFDHINRNPPVLIRTPKLTRFEPAQYWGGGPPGNSVVLNPFFGFVADAVPISAGQKEVHKNCWLLLSLESWVFMSNDFSRQTITTDEPSSDSGYKKLCAWPPSAYKVERVKPWLKTNTIICDAGYKLKTLCPNCVRISLQCWFFSHLPAFLGRHTILCR